MKSVLVFIDGILCDWRQRQHLEGTPDFYKREIVMKDIPVPGSVRCLQELVRRYQIVYIGARPDEALAATEEWLRTVGFPAGSVYVAKTRAERLALVKTFKDRFEFAAGLGARWDDNQLHLELGCLSIILKEFEADWDVVRQHLLGREHTALQTAITLLTPWAKNTLTPIAHRLDVALDLQDLLPAVKALRDVPWGYLSAIVGLDHADSNEIEVVYVFCSGAAIVTLRVRTPHVEGAVPSVCAMIPSATFFERELSEMFGITVVNTPNPDRLFLPDEWPTDVYPLRKDFVVPHPFAEN